MNWKWLIPIWGIEVAIQDSADNHANDYMKYRLPIVALGQMGVLTFLFSVVFQAL